MTQTDLVPLLPLIILAVTVVVMMLAVAFGRNHRLTAGLALAGLALAFLALPLVAPATPHQVALLMTVDGFALFFMGLLFAAGFVVVLLSYGYLEGRDDEVEEYYILLVLATLGAAVLAASTHFASFFLGLEVLSVSLYALIAYLRASPGNIEAGIKYLVLAAASAAFLLFGMALVYAELGTMEFARMAAPVTTSLLLLAGLGMMVVGFGFKLAVVPFHMWTPDVYEGAPAPVTAFVATVSKGAIFAVLLRFFSQASIAPSDPMFVVLALIAVASMLAGNLLALLQNNVKRILAYSSISHLGYLLVAFLASGALAVTASTFYLVAYFVTTLAGFGVITVLSGRDRDADRLDDYRGLFWRRPLLAGVFTVSLLSLAGIPLTAGFVGKFYVLAAGVGSALWGLVLVLVAASAIGLFYYLRVVLAMYGEAPEGQARPAAAVSLLAGSALAALTLALVWLGVYPAPLIQMIQSLFA